MAERVPKDAKEAPAYPIASVDNALRLLLMFRGEQRLRLSDAASSLGVAASTAHRLLAMLCHHDFVRQEGDMRTYVAGPALLDVGLAAVRNMDIRTYARPILDDLAQKVEETVHLAQLEGRNVRYLAAAECSRPLRVAGRTGLVLPAWATATGKAMLAELPPVQLDELFPRVPEGADGLTAAARSQLDAELAEVRERGYATNHHEAHEDIISVATVVRDLHGSTVAALNASAPTNRMAKKRRLEVVRQLHAAAARLEDALAARERG
jgi:IclR family acetate operon transcriptional repressor